MIMPYTGNLVRISQAPDARKLPAPSPRHGLVEGDPSQPRGEHSVPAGTGAEFGGTNFPPVIMAGFGMPLDTPRSWAGPPPGGGAESPYEIVYAKGNPHDSRAILSAAGALDTCYNTDGSPLRTYAHEGAIEQGWKRVKFSPEPLFQATQGKQEIDTEGLTSPYGVGDTTHTKFVRGINSLPENNPDRVGYVTGFRPGRERVRVWDNAVRAHISRQISPQILQPRDAYTPNSSRPMVDRMIIGVALPRDAPNPDDNAMAATNYDSSTMSVFGGF